MGGLVKGFFPVSHSPGAAYSHEKATVLWFGGPVSGFLSTVLGEVSLPSILPTLLQSSHVGQTGLLTQDLGLNWGCKALSLPSIPFR